MEKFNHVQGRISLSALPALVNFTLKFLRFNSFNKNENIALYNSFEGAKRGLALIAHQPGQGSLALVNSPDYITKYFSDNKIDYGWSLKIVSPLISASLCSLKVRAHFRASKS